MAPIMRPIVRRGVTLLAIYAVVLHVILLGFVPIAGNAATVDPLSIICHSASGTAGDKAPATPGLIPGHACEHCNLCSVTAPPPAPDVALAGRMGPARVLHVLRPASMHARAGLTSDPRLARGPPHAA
jgi:hypothetical protein